jgi:hypothetical protein
MTQSITTSNFVVSCNKEGYAAAAQGAEGKPALHKWESVSTIGPGLMQNIYAYMQTALGFQG